MSEQPASERVRVRRGANRAIYDRDAIDAIIDAALFCTVSIVLPEGLRQIPISHVRDGERIYLHGHRRNAVLTAIAAGGEACVSFVVVDGLVMARSAAGHSVNFRSVVLYGRGTEVADPAAKLRALRLLTERFAPGRWDEVRPPTDADLASTLMVSLPTAEASAKSRSGPPRQRDGDAGWPAWAGVVPVSWAEGTPVPLDDVAAAVESPTIRGLR